jgi:hypothetical protein
MLVPVYWRGVVCIWVLCSVVGRTIWIWFVDQLSHSPRLQALLCLCWVTQFFSITLENWISSSCYEIGVRLVVLATRAPNEPISQSALVISLHTLKICIEISNGDFWLLWQFCIDGSFGSAGNLQEDEADSFHFLFPLFLTEYRRRLPPIHSTFLVPLLLVLWILLSTGCAYALLYFKPSCLCNGNLNSIEDLPIKYSCNGY